MNTGENSGLNIDFDHLKAKYKSGNFTSEEKSGIEASIQNREKQKDFERLDKYKICEVCKGLGIVKEIYNHRVVDKNCPHCNGESILQVSK